MPATITWRTVRRTPALSEGVLAGIAVLVAGFGALSVMWHVGDWPKNLPGLWDYRSATVGDGILLPLMIAILTAAGSRSQRPGGHNRLIWGSVVLAMVVGAAIQVAWLLDPHPRLNWGTPSPDHVTVAGVYHAAFFVLVYGAVSGLAVRALIRLRGLRTTDPTRLRDLLGSPLASLLIACSAGFVGLVVLDRQSLERYGQPSTWTSLSAAASAVAAMIFVATMVVISLGAAVTPEIRRMLWWGAVLAGSILLATWRPRHFLGGLHTGELAVLGTFCALLAGQMWVWRERSKFWWVAAATAVLIATAGVGFCLMAAAGDPVFATVSAIATWILLRLTVAAPTVSHRLRRHALRTVSPEDYVAVGLATSLLLPLSLLILARWLDGGGTASWSGGATDRVVGTALAALGTLGAWKYKKLYEQDQILGAGKESEGNAWAAYLTILAMFFAALFGIFSVLHGSISLINIDPPHARAIPDLPKVVAAACIALFLALLGTLAAEPTRPETRHGLSLRHAPVQLNPMVTSLQAGALAIWAGAPWIFLLDHRGIRVRSTILPSMLWELPFIVFVLLISGWIGYTSADSIRANIAEIEILRLSHRACLVAVVAGIATGSTALWLFVEGFFSTSAPARVDSLALATSTVAVSNLAILSAVTGAFARSWPRHNGRFFYMALHHPVTHVANDHFLQTGLLFITMTTTYLGWRTLNWLSVPRTPGEAVTAFAAIAAPFTVASAFVKGVTMGTDTHIHDERMRVRYSNKAGNIHQRARIEIGTPVSLNEERLEKICERFRRIQRTSKILSLYAPAAIGFIWRLFFPPPRTNPDNNSAHQERTT